MAPQLIKVTDEHYEKWQKTFKNESKKYNIKDIKDIATVEQEPKMLGRQLVMVLNPNN